MNGDDKSCPTCWIDDKLVFDILIEIWDSITKIPNYWKSYQKVTFSVLSMQFDYTLAQSYNFNFLPNSSIEE